MGVGGLARRTNDAPDPTSDLTSIIEAWWRGLRPPATILVSEHATKHRVLSGKHAARRGPWDNRVTPHLVRVMDALAVTSSFEKVVCQKAAQIAFTTAAENWIQYLVDVAPGPILAMFPTLDLAKDFSESRLDPMIEESDLLRGLIAPPRSRDSKNRRLSKAFPGGDLKLRGANSPSGLRSVSARYLIADEVDEYGRNVKGQGRALVLARRALKTFPNRKEFVLSTPTLEGASQIVEEFEACEQAWEYQVPCPFCAVWQALPTPLDGWERIRWPKWEGDLAKSARGGVLDARDARGAPVDIPGVEVQCIGCKAWIAEHHKATMLREDGWRPLWNRGDKSIGFRMSALAATTAMFSWGRAAAAYELGIRNPEDMRVVYNHVFGIPYAEQHETPDWRRLYERRESYRAGVVPDGGLLLTAFCDVQKAPARLECELKAWGRHGENWSVWYEAFPAVDLDDDLNDPAWANLTKFLQREWPCPNGVTLPIHALGIDSGYLPEPVYRWARRHPGPAVSAAGVAVRAQRTVVVTKGADTWDRAIYAPRATDAGRKKRGVYVLTLGVSGLKAELYRWLRQDRPTPEEVAAGAAVPFGTCHHPAYAEGYFQGLVAERLIVKTKHGSPDPVWVKQSGVPGEPLDCHVGARAMAVLCGIDRFSEAQWKQLERRRYGDAGPPVRVVVGAAPAPEAPSVETPAGARLGGVPTVRRPRGWTRPQSTWAAPRRPW